MNLLIDAGQLAIVVFGFGMVIVIHELGHFLAARWAGIRVHDFAVGFGPALCSWRKGVGFRRGSTLPDYERLAAKEPNGPRGLDAKGVSPTEYRLNALPIGGYVRMLGQDDMAPSSTSQEPDAYTAQPVWKRLIVISAGVIANAILAAALFVIVFMIGLDVPPSRVGAVLPGSPAAEAVALNAKELGVAQSGLQPGDEITHVNGREALSFKDLIAAAGLARRGDPVELRVRRAGFDAPLRFAIEPTMGERTRLLELGVASPVSLALARPGASSAERMAYDAALEAAGLADLAPGDRIIAAQAEPISEFHELARPERLQTAAPIDVVVERRTGATETRRIELSPAMQHSEVMAADATGKPQPLSAMHLLGLTPTFTVVAVEPRAARMGLRPGDVIARVGERAWPNIVEGIQGIRKRAGGGVSITVLRDGEEIALEPTVRGDGTIGFTPGRGLDHPILASTLSPADAPLPAAALRLPPGTRVLEIGGAPVSDFASIREALRSATREAHALGEGATVSITLALPIQSARQTRETQEWTLDAETVTALHALGWRLPVDPRLFRLTEDTLRAESPLRALDMGLSETRRVVVMTYVTLLRLFEGTVKVEHLRGPVGIAHLGTQVVDRGAMQLLFFLAVISANLAVLNFLPLPIVDGGHVVFLLIEGVTGKPVSARVQSAAMLVGLVLLGGVFVIVTFNDITSILG